MKVGRNLIGNRVYQRIILPIVVILSLLAPVMVQPSFAAVQPRLHYQLKRSAAAQPNKIFRVIVTRLNNNRQADTRVAARGGQKIKEVAGGGFVAMIRGKDLPTLGADPSIKYIAPDAPMVYTGVVDSSKMGTLYAAAANATSLWTGSSPVTGAGIGVAIVDTGITNRCDFNNANGNSRIIARTLYSTGNRRTDDGNGHGTHVAGIVAGNSWNCTDSRYSSNPIRGKYVGIAPEANLINVRVSDEDGMAYVSDIVNAIEWVINNRQSLNIRVMNLSLVSSIPESYHTSLLDAIVEKAWFNGIFVTVAAGNAGVNTMGYPPANDPFVITVGAADPMDSASQNDDTMAPWSSFGITQDGFLKPDVAAVGRYMVSPLAGPYVTLAQEMPERITDNNYIRLSGTSMASPVVAGIAALAFQKHPEWTNDQLKWVMMNTTTTLGRLLPALGQGAGEVNAGKVVNYVGTPKSANQGLLINEQLIGPNGITSYLSGMLAPSSTWSTSTWSTSTWSTSTWSTSTWSTSTWSSTTNWEGADAE